jgi:3-hydroxyacyl-CoA dehydrogenase
MNRQIKNVVVLGASGTVGSLVGGLLAQRGLNVAFISRSTERAKRGLARAIAQARSEVIAKNITCGDYAALFPQAAPEADWIIEATTEDREIKRQIYERVETSRRPGSVVSSTTSSLPLTLLAEGRKEDFQRHFLSTHFYNPPGRMLACELTGHEGTDPDLVRFMAEYLRRELHRVVIPVKNAAAFAGNRIAFVLFSRITSLVERYGVELMDYLIGPYTGRLMPPLATLDLVGLDIHRAIIHSLQTHTHDAMHDWLTLPPYVETMIQRGLLGRKRGAGFYKKLESGKFVFFDPDTCDYIPAIQPHIAFVEKAKHFIRVGKYRNAFETILAAEGTEAELVVGVLCAYIVYSYSLIGEVTPPEHGIAGMDVVMSAGFNWAPPSMILEMLGGPESVLQRCQAKGLPIPVSLESPKKTPLQILEAAKYFAAK